MCDTRRTIHKRLQFFELLGFSINLPPYDNVSANTKYIILTSFVAVLTGCESAIQLFKKSLAGNMTIILVLTIDFVLSGRAAMGGGGGSSSTSLLVAADVTLPPPSVSGVVDEGLLLDGWLKLC